MDDTPTCFTLWNPSEPTDGWLSKLQETMRDDWATSPFNRSPDGFGVMGHSRNATGRVGNSVTPQQEVSNKG